MAKKEMICPFLRQLCKNCAIYIGRHYYLCYSTKFRGYMGRRKTASKAITHRIPGTTTKKFKIPIIKVEALDPFMADL